MYNISAKRQYSSLREKQSFLCQSSLCNNFLTNPKVFQKYAVIHGVRKVLNFDVTTKLQLAGKITGMDLSQWDLTIFSYNLITERRNN